MDIYGKDMAPPMPQPLWDVHMALCLTTKHWGSMLDEASVFSESLAQLAQADRSILSNTPCIVITAGALPDAALLALDKSWESCFQEMMVVWGCLQKELVAKFKNGRQIIAEKSDHMIPWHQPELIVKAVQELINSQEQ